MSLIRYLLLASLILVGASNLTTFGVASANLNLAANVDRNESKETITDDREVEKPKDRDVFSQLNLTDAQKQQIISIRSGYEERIQAKRNTLKASHKELQNLLSSSSPADSVRDRYREVAKQRQELSDLLLSRMLEVREVLNEEQRSQLLQIMQSRANNRRQSDR
jgi:periplasmic protein CpxP/Spy